MKEKIKNISSKNYTDYINKKVNESDNRVKVKKIVLRYKTK